MIEDRTDEATLSFHRWKECAENAESPLTCSFCTYPPADYHSNWGGASVRVEHQPYALHFNGTVPLHGFVHAVHEAYRRHLPLTIAVEDIWILIIQGVSQHINYGDNAERLRHHFVSHEGKEDLQVRASSWEGVCNLRPRAGAAHSAWPRLTLRSTLLHHD